MLFGVATSEEPSIATETSGLGITPKDVLDYTFILKKNLVNMVGLSTVPEVEETLEAAEDYS